MNTQEMYDRCNVYDKFDDEENPVTLKEVAREVVICCWELFKFVMAAVGQFITDVVNHDWKKEFSKIYESNRVAAAEFGWFIYYLYCLPFMMIYVTGEMAIHGMYGLVRRKPTPEPIPPAA